MEIVLSETARPFITARYGLPMEQVELDRRGRVAVLTLNRPDRLNAWTPRMAFELYSSLRDLDADDATRAIVVTGAGRAFCAGAELDASGDTFATEGKWAVDEELTRATRPWNLRTPVIGALNGHAVGIGATLPLGFDVRIASEDAKTGFVFTRRGIVPEASSTWILPRLIGFGRAMELLVSGRVLLAQEALRYGVVDRVVPKDRVLDEALELAEEIATHAAPVSVAITKQLLWRQLGEPDPERARQLEDRLFYWSGQQPDAREGVRSFMDERDPEWSMTLDDFPAELFGEP